MKRVIGWPALLVVAVAGACDRGEPERLAPVAGPADVEVTMPVRSAGVARFMGTVAAVREAELATRMSGTVMRVEVEVGARVRAGAALVRLDEAEVEARIAAAESQARLAGQWHERVAALARDGASTAQELDDATTRLETARAMLREAMVQRDYVVLRAPFDGVVAARLADPGDLAVPGRPVLRLVGSGGVKIRADLPAGWAGAVRPGDAVVVVHGGSGERVAGRVSRTVPAFEVGSRRFRIEAEIPAEAQLRLLPGTFVRLEFDEVGQATRWIPADAVVRRGQLAGAFVVEGERLRLRWLRLGIEAGDAVEVLAGPLDGPVVRSPAPALVDGQPVGRATPVSWEAGAAGGGGADR